MRLTKYAWCQAVGASLALGLQLAPAGTRAQENGAGESIHWAYAAYFGTGRYEIDSGESVYQLSARPSKRFDRFESGADGRRVAGIELRVPVAVGVHHIDFNDVGSILKTDNVSTLSAVPGVEVDLRMSDRWSLKPSAYIGWGSELGGDASAWIYWTGLKSRLSFTNDAFDWTLVNAITYLGYTSDTHQRGRALPLLTGVEFERPHGRWKLGGNRVRLHWHVAFTTYLEEVESVAAQATLNPPSIDDEWEVGAAFSTEGTGLRWRRLHLDRVGLAYRFSSDGHFEGIGVTFKSLFDR
jgi:hypothetical protein